MDSEFRRVKDLFLAALEKDDPAQRSALLTQECGADTDLRRRVESLLRQHEQAGNFLEESVSEAPPPISAEGPGTYVGSYKLLEKIGGPLWPGVAAAEEEFKRRAAAIGMGARELRRQKRDNYLKQYDLGRKLREGGQAQAE